MQFEVRVPLGQHSYPILIGRGLLGDSQWIAPRIRDRALVVSNDRVAGLYLEPLLAGLHGRQVDALVLPDGERYKTLESAERIWTHLLSHRHGRDTTLIALGGGVIGDLTGFAAACYQRGVDFVQVPTTLLAQVDSSVGGKTGVNHPLGKNMIGAFHQPQLVVADTATLESLPAREFAAGMAEVIKYGLIRDAGFFAWIEQHLEQLLARDADAVAEAVRRSCEHKAQVVARDEREAGERALLNLGHTFGHAIETETGYSEWLHGEAVAMGTMMAADLSVRLGWCPENQLAKIAAVFAAFGLPTAAPKELGTDALLDAMRVDKKVAGGEMRLVLLRCIGQAEILRAPDPVHLRETLEQVRMP